MRRNGLGEARWTGSTHPGLWLDKYVPRPREAHEAAGETDAQSETYRDVASFRPDGLYADAYRRWERELGSVSRMVLAKAEVLGRLAIGLGAASVLETSISLHHTYGVPVIRGTALKGLCARFARQRLEAAEWRKEGEAYRILFGDTATAGHVTFHDALWVPSSKGTPPERPFALDVMAVHHREYYGGNDASPPADWDEPVPISFLTARGEFLVALEGPVAWAEAALGILEKALAEEGIGAKTSAGYGRMKVTRYSPQG